MDMLVHLQVAVCGDTVQVQLSTASANVPFLRHHDCALSASGMKRPPTASLLPPLLFPAVRAQSAVSGARGRRPNSRGAKLSTVEKSSTEEAKSSSSEELIAKRLSARISAKSNADRAMASLAAARAQAQVKRAREEEAAAATITNLWARFERAAERTGLRPYESIAAARAFRPEAEVVDAATKLSGIAFEARRVGAQSLAQRAVRLSHRSLSLARVLKRSSDLEDAWRKRQAEEIRKATKRSESRDASSLSRGSNRNRDEDNDLWDPTTEGQVLKAYRMSKRFRAAATLLTGQSDQQPEPASMDLATAASTALGENPAPDAKTAREQNRPTYWNAVGHVMIEPTAYKAAMSELPPVILVPNGTANAICASLAPVLLALNQGVDMKSKEYLAAKNAIGSWHHTSWLDARSNTKRSKPAKGWTTEQYSLTGFAGLYAKTLHVARVATVRQIMLWLLDCAPGLPRDAPIAIGDLGAGTCAACLGARFALRDYCGGEHPFRVWPIDVASSSAQFREAFGAMTQGCPGPGWSSLVHDCSKEAFLPDQRTEQYLTEERDGVDALAKSLLEQVRARGERQPHLILASFSLHYLKGVTTRARFFDLLRTTVSRPLLLLIVKGVDSLQRHTNEPMVPSSVPSVFLGLHYYIGRDPKPRVAEAHLCLIRPSAGRNTTTSEDPAAEEVDEGGPRKWAGAGAGTGKGLGSVEYNREDPDAWVESTFAALRCRVERHGLHTGVTEMTNKEKLA